MTNHALSSTAEPKGGTTRVLEKARLVLVYVPGGYFLMGSADEDPDVGLVAKPPHMVHLHGFWVGQTEVTNAQYRRFIEAGGYGQREHWTDEGWRWREKGRITQPEYWHEEKWNQPGFPVVGVSWYEAAAFARWAGVRLPTEAEWEYAARSGALREGSCYAGSDEANSDKRTHLIRQKRPDELGLCDMSGNLWEWCQDWWEERYYGWPVGSNEPELPRVRVMRGGSWYMYLVPPALRCAHSLGVPVGLRLFVYSFRVVLGAR